MYAGGYRKEEFDVLIMEAPREAAIAAFTTIFDHEPTSSACSHSGCCGPDYEIDQYDTLETCMALTTRYHSSAEIRVILKPELDALLSASKSSA